MQTMDRCPACGSRTSGPEADSHRPDLRGFLIRAVKLALVVGTGLTVINQTDALLAGAPPAALWWKIPLTYAVPFCVSLYSSVATSRSRR